MSEPAWGAVEVTGSDARGFLQGQLTQDMDRVAAGRTALAAWCNAQGRVLAAFRVLPAAPDRFRLVMPAELLEDVARRLRLFVLRADAQVSALPEKWRCGAFGAAAAGEAAAALGLSLPREPGAGSTDGACWLARLAHGEPAFELCGPADRVSSLPLPADFAPQRLAAGIPSVHRATQGAFLPQMLNLDLLDAVSLHKGCYVGQEIVARTQNLGRIKRRMLLLAAPVSAETAPGEPLYADGEATGRVTASASGLLLAVAPIARFPARWSLDAEGQLALTRRPLPYAIPEEKPLQPQENAP